MRPYFLLSLPKPSHRRKYKEATEDIELNMDGTKAWIIAMHSNSPGDPPAPLEIKRFLDNEGIMHDEESGPYTFCGYVLGPDHLGDHLNPISTTWGKELISILESHGLKHLSTELIH